MFGSWLEYFCSCGRRGCDCRSRRVVAPLAIVDNSSPASLVRLRVVTSSDHTFPVPFTRASKGQRISSSNIHEVGIMLSIFCGIGEGSSGYPSIRPFPPC